jgi:hypothetical protein
MNLQNRSWKFYLGWSTLAVLLAIIVIVHIYLNAWLLSYVNRTLNNIPHYQGSVYSIDLDLYRGAYRINDLKLYKKEGNIPTPFIAIDAVDLSLQWSALIHGRIVSSIDLEKPVLNFAVNKGAAQTGTEADWNKPIKALMPIDINHVIFRDGELAYKDFASTPNVDIFIHHMSGEVRNLRNVVDKEHPMPSTLVVKGDSIGEGNLVLKGRLNILKEIPDMDIYTQLENVHMQALNSYSNAYAALDFKGGTVNVYSEFIIKDNQVSGYVKPIAKNISLVDLSKEANPVKVAWESVVSTIVTIFTNQRNDQFATRIDLSGSLSKINTNTWSAVAGIIKNAFLSAVKKGFDVDNADDSKTLPAPPDVEKQ